MNKKESQVQEHFERPTSRNQEHFECWKLLPYLKLRFQGEITGFEFWSKLKVKLLFSICTSKFSVESTEEDSVSFRVKSTTFLESILKVCFARL